MTWRKWILSIAILGFILFITLALIGKIGNARLEAQKARVMSERKAEVSAGVVVIPEAVYIDYLDEKRRLHIYLPPDYDQSDQTYPVIYMLDGAALFNSMEMDGPEWQLDERIDEVAESGGPGAIVIGIDNSKERMTEYKPFRSVFRPEEAVTGDQHIEWIATDLKAWVDSTYRTKSDPGNTAIGGASLGGLMAYYAVMKHPDVFSNALALSPSFWVNEAVYDLHKEIENLNQFKIYLSVGKKEGSMVRDARKVVKLLEGAGMESENLRFNIQNGLDHWHYTWRLAFQDAYPWIVND